MKKIIITLTSLAVILLTTAVVFTILKSRQTTTDEIPENTPSTSTAAKQPQEITWPEITADGVNEELLLQNVDQDLLEQIAYELQTLVAEAAEEEREDPELVIREGWTRVWQYERYQKVLALGAPAMKPLYLIVYKSPYAGEYEYLCANILYEL